MMKVINKIKGIFSGEKKYYMPSRRAIIRWSEDALRDNTGGKEIDIFMEGVSFTMPFISYEHASGLEQSLSAPIMDLTGRKDRPRDDVVSVLHPDALPIARF